MSVGANSVHLVVNPVSGIGRSRRFVEALTRRLRDGGFAVQTTRTSGPGEARLLGRDSCGGGCRALVVVGGDGTVNEVVQGLCGDGVPILAVPAGTENILAKYLGIVADDDWLCDVVRRGREVRFDIAEMNDRRFLLVAGVGFDAEVVRRLVCQRRGHISRANYFWPIWRTFLGYRQPILHVEADGKLLHVGPGLAFVGNIPRYAIDLRILQRAKPDDRLLDVCVFPCTWQGPLVRHAVNVLLRRHIGRNGVVYRQARHVRVWSEQRMGIQLDGEWAGFGPAEFQVSGVTARFLVSSQWDSGRSSTETI
ncbi:MAG: diacylglycerol kinase family protein [Planctomycetota bacterium]|nr:diacylglycerol kinase family protein [Planctomycetota bacterium]